MNWHPHRYGSFQAARQQPAADLVALVPKRTYARIIDLGCGTGEQALALAQCFSSAAVVGLDSSAEMLQQAQRHRQPNLVFRQGDIATLEECFDLIYSSAALQWLPDQPALLRRLWHRLNAGGTLAVHLPANHTHISHRLLTETANEFAGELQGYTRFGAAHDQLPVLDLPRYAELIDGLGAVEMNMQKRIYPVVFEGAEELLSWMRGTALVPYLSRLSVEDGTRFEAAYLRRLKAAFPSQRVFYAFERILFAAVKAG